MIIYKHKKRRQNKGLVFASETLPQSTVQKEQSSSAFAGHFPKAAAT